MKCKDSFNQSTLTCSVLGSMKEHVSNRLYLVPISVLEAYSTRNTLEQNQPIVLSDHPVSSRPCSELGELLEAAAYLLPFERHALAKYFVFSLRGLP